MCHRANEDRAWRCACGYEFGQPVDRTLELLRGQAVTAKITLGVFVALDAAAAFGMYVAALHGLIFFPGIVVVALVIGTIRPIRKLAIARESTRLLSAKLLPTARVVRSPGPAPTPTASAGSESDR
jgi:hypothetical protein